MKLTRTLLLRITAGLGVFLIAYSLFRYFTGIHVNEELEKFLMDGIVFAALGLFIYNRKLSADEKKAREAKEHAELPTELPTELPAENEAKQDEKE
ncbi:hypothetical protein [Treponema primitia]|uniref:hypothetical protein n=1 Tax=Treponema primitia TaxID=88058 RepID=UPI0018E14362|nr:hypothetical protein [Treponema primitia]